jgi:O-antigen ligase
MGTIFAFGIVFELMLIVFWQRMNRMVVGYDDGDRMLQWQLAMPQIESNPITGHGMGTSGILVGYHLEAGVPSVDSYIITLLVETGVPGLLLFFATIAIAIWMGLRVYLSDKDPRASIGCALACSLIAFATYRTALSQTENHSLVFFIIGLIFVMGRCARDRRLFAHAAGHERSNTVHHVKGNAIADGSIKPTAV